MWERIPQDNKSEYIRNVLRLYMSGELVEGTDIKVIERENRLLHQQVDELKQDKQWLKNELSRLRDIYLPRQDKKWWQFWK